MCKPRNVKARKPRKRKTRGKKFLSALVAAAAAIPTISVPNDVEAQTIAQKSEFRFQYSYYEDRQGSDDRITVNAPMAWFRAPLGKSTEVEGSAVYDSISGASPLYLDTLSGASGQGIEDNRIAGNIRVTEYFDDFNISVGTVYSDEDDWTSVGGSVGTQIWSEDKNTTFSIGASYTSDEITSSNDPTLDENRDTIGGLLGITQVLDRNSIFQSNITYQASSGYHSDPYKIDDRRPETRDRLAWLNRYVLYVPSLEGSFHIDYRYYRDSWGIISHTFDNMWYQPLDEVWMLRPHIRFYSQNEADFFSSVFPSPSSTGSASYDQRLAGFGELTTGLKLIRSLGDDLSLSLNYEFIQQRNAWKIGSKGTPGISNFYESIISVGIYKTF